MGHLGATYGVSSGCSFSWRVKVVGFGWVCCVGSLGGYLGICYGFWFVFVAVVSWVGGALAR